MTLNQRPLLPLAGLTLVGIASLYALPIEQLLPARAQTIPVPLLRLGAMVQPLLLALLALWLGGRFAPRLGLGTPLFAAAAAGEPLAPLLRARLPAIAGAALLSGLVLLLWGRLVVPHLGITESSLTRLAPPLALGMLYGGIVEEVMMRWGLLSALAALALRLGAPRTSALYAAALLAALLFGLGHLPAFGLIAPHAPSWAPPAVVLANAVPGLLFGLLFIRHGLEAAMLAHAGAHLLNWALA